MITKTEFFKKFPTLESFQKKHKIGEIFKYYDRTYWEIRGYMEDEFPDGEKLTLAILRTCVRYKDDEGNNVRHWSYKAQELFDFYSVYDFCKREWKKEFNKKSWDDVEDNFMA